MYVTCDVIELRYVNQVEIKPCEFNRRVLNRIRQLSNRFDVNFRLHHNAIANNMSPKL